jgi:hypothetical protein
MYLTSQDVPVLIQWLTQTKEIGFIVSDGPRRWRAVPTIHNIPDDPISLWHVPSGPLPLYVGPRGDQHVEEVKSPWDGWDEKRSGGDFRQPFFGSSNSGVMRMTILLESKYTWIGFNRKNEPSGAIGLSGIEWIGNHYKIIGEPAKPETERFWKKLRRFVASQASRITRVGPIDGPRPEAYAFKKALEEIKNGRGRAVNPG